MGLPMAGAAKREPVIREPTPEAMEAWLGSLRQQFAGTPSALCLARNQGPSGFAWRQDACLVLLPVHPLPLTRSRDAFPPSRAQDDPTDAALQLAWRCPHHDKQQPRTPPRPTRRALAPRVAHRRRVGGDTGRLTQRLTRTLKHSCPQAPPWFQDQDPRLFCDGLSRWPPRKAVPRARRAPGDRLARAPRALGRRSSPAPRRQQRCPPLTTAAGLRAPQALCVQGPHSPTPGHLARPPRLRPRHRAARPAPSRLPLVPAPAGRWPRLRSSPPRGLVGPLLPGRALGACAGCGCLCAPSPWARRSRRRGR